MIDARTRRPLSGALVWRDAEPAHARVTAGDGTYRLTLSPRAAGWVHALAPGYVPELDSAGATSVDRSYVFALEPAARLTGKVVDESGAPVAGAEIVALADTQRSPRRSLGLAPPLAHARSRADGGFGLGRLAFDTAYDLRITRPGFAPLEHELAPLSASPPAVHLGVRRAAPWPRCEC